MVLPRLANIKVQQGPLLIILSAGLEDNDGDGGLVTSHLIMIYALLLHFYWSANMNK